MKKGRKSLRLQNKAICEYCGKKAYGAILLLGENNLRKLCKSHYVMHSIEWEKVDLKHIYEN